MAQPAVPPTPAQSQSRPAAAPRVPVREILPWAAFALILGAVLLYFVGAEQGATALFGGTWVHEFTHDGRHLLGFPCH